MSEGLMWFSKDPDTRAVVLEAIKRYTDKFCAIPNICHVHPAAMPDWDEIRLDTMEVVTLVPDPSMPNRYHYLIGEREEL